MNKLTEEIRKASLLWVLWRPIYIAKQPKEIQSILLNPRAINKSRAYDFIDFLYGSILMLDYGRYIYKCI